MAKKKKKETAKDVRYEAEDIDVLEGLDPVRKRPAMYIGSTGTQGLHHLIWECLDNAIDEAIAGYATEATIELLPDGKVRVSDNGRGIPVTKHPQTNKSALETVMTTLHAGAKFSKKSYQVSGGLHGVGVSVVCALSDYFKAEVCRKGTKYYQEYSRGEPETKVKKEGKCDHSGTTVIFSSDEEIFKTTDFKWKKILSHLRQQAYLTKGMKIWLMDKREEDKEKDYTFYFEGGIKSYIKYLVGNTKVRHPDIFYLSEEKDDVQVEVALQYTEDVESLQEGFANNIYTPSGGTHMSGFKTALTRTLNSYARDNDFLKESDSNLSGSAVREGLTAVVSVKVKEPQFEGQTKAKLGNSEVKGIVQKVFSVHFEDFLERNPKQARSIIEGVMVATEARRAAKKARETVLKRKTALGLSLPGKLADCSSRNPGKRELFIVEGESAGGCFSGDTEVALVDGRNISFIKLVEEFQQGKQHYCYTIKDDGSVGIDQIKNPRLTKKEVPVVKVVLDNQQEIVCTPDHQFMLRDGHYKEAQNLTSEDSLMPLRRQLSRESRRFSGHSEEKPKQTIPNSNHKMEKVVKLEQDMDVYDLEVEGTHNFALTAGVFVHNSAKQARDRKFQAILPLKGKILNVEKAQLNRILSSKEIKNLIVALGTAIGEDFNLDKLRYHKTIVMTDADSVTGDTPVLLFNKQNQEFSLKEVEEFIEGDNNHSEYQILTHNSQNNKSELKDIYRTIKHSLKTPLYQIKTYCGYPVKITDCHSIYVYQDGEVTTKKGSQIKSGDTLLFPKKLPSQNKEYIFDLTDTILNSGIENVSVKVPSEALASVPERAWCELNQNSWNNLQDKRKKCRLSRKEIGTKIRVYDKVIQQWEKKIDNVMPRAAQFEKYLTQLSIDQYPRNTEVYVPIKDWSRGMFSQAEFYLRNHTNRIRTKFSLDQDLAYFLGFYLGDGCYTPQTKNSNRFVLSINQEDSKDYIDKLSQIVKEKFGAKPIIDERKRDHCIRFTFHSIDFKFLLMHLGLLNKKASEKFIPQALFNVDSKIQQHLLRGLLQSDGFITVWKPGDTGHRMTVRYGWKLSSPKLIQGIVTILRQWGIFPSYAEGKQRSHSRQDGTIVKGNHNFTAYVATIPYLRKTKEVWKNHKDASKLENYLQSAGEGRGKEIKDISEDFVGLKVKQVKKIKNPSPQFVYDFSVKENQNFVAGSGGMLLHNSDGNHIQTLLLTLFYRYFKPIIEEGYLYIAQPPLYKITKGKKIHYVYNERQKKKALKSMKGSPNIQRFKGLGEMNPGQLWNTTMNPKKRILKKVTIEDAVEADQVFDNLMGKQVAPRKKFIQSRAQKVQHLDI